MSLQQTKQKMGELVVVSIFMMWMFFFFSVIAPITLSTHSMLHHDPRVNMLNDINKHANYLVATNDTIGGLQLQESMLDIVRERLLHICVKGIHTDDVYLCEEGVKVSEQEFRVTVEIDGKLRHVVSRRHIRPCWFIVTLHEVGGNGTTGKQLPMSGEHIIYITSNIDDKN